MAIIAESWGSRWSSSFLNSSMPYIRVHDSHIKSKANSTEYACVCNVPLCLICGRLDLLEHEYVRIMQAYARANAVFEPGMEKHSIKLLMQRLQASPSPVEAASTSVKNIAASKTLKVRSSAGIPGDSPLKSSKPFQSKWGNPRCWPLFCSNLNSNL